MRYSNRLKDKQKENDCCALSIGRVACLSGVKRMKGLGDVEIIFVRIIIPTFLKGWLPKWCQ